MIIEIVLVGRQERQFRQSMYSYGDAVLDEEDVLSGFGCKRDFGRGDAGDVRITTGDAEEMLPAKETQVGEWAGL